MFGLTVMCFRDGDMACRVARVLKQLRPIKHPRALIPFRDNSTIASVMTSSGRPATPRPSASLVVVDEKNRVLMVERSPEMKSFAKAFVFPGGTRDTDDTSERMTAIRETFEEAGLLLASPTPSLDKQALDVARKSIHAQRLSFTTFLANNNITPDVDSLLPFTQWITPPTLKRRFHTHFFITFLPSASSVGLSSEKHWQHHVPTPDGGVEVISARFLTPQDAISEFHAKKIALMPPQFYILTTLSSVLSGDRNTVEQRNIITRLAHGAFGSLRINPRALPEKDEQGLIILTYEGDETRGGRLGARHRAHVFSGQEGMHVVSLERNLDIFSDVFFEAKGRDISKL